MRIIALEYHDVVAANDWDESGFPGRDAATYKLDDRQFTAHLEALAARGMTSARTVFEALQEHASSGPLLTFDDGGSSAAGIIADRLEAAGWIGHFFIPTRRIGSQGFVSPHQIRDLHDRGHVIGSHSASHPLRMSACPDDVIAAEWGESTEALSSVLGEPVTAASIPGGHFSSRVAKAAATAGITALFTSEPTTRVGSVGTCAVVGRYTLRRDSRPAYAAALASGSMLPCAKQWMLWNIKKAAKKVLGGEHYLRLRRQLLR